MTLTDTPPVESGHTRARLRRGPVVAAALLVVLIVVAAAALMLTRGGGTQAPDVGTGPVDAAPPARAKPDVSSGEPLSWAPPMLEDPEVVMITSEDADLKLDQSKDYELVMPNVPLETGLTVFGGHNVVLVGGEVRSESEDGERGLYLRDQTGTVHIEGLLLSGSTLDEGINLDQREGAVVQLQNIRIDNVEGSRNSNHADLIQTWAGPRQLLVDGFTGTTTYQGLFLLPQQFGDQPEPELFDLRRVDITGDEGGSAYMLWRDDEDWPLVTDQVHVAPTGSDTGDRRGFLWDRKGDDSWGDVMVGAPANGPFVPEGRAGIGYVSPGYASE